MEEDERNILSSEVLSIKIGKLSNNLKVLKKTSSETDIAA